MIRISTTTLESFRRVLTNEYAEEEELIASIKGKPFSPTWQMKGGTAWHTVLEGKDRDIEWFTEDDISFARYGDFIFHAEAVLAGRKHIGPGLWEVKATRTFDVLGQPVTVVAQADHVRGLLIQDNKTKWSTPDAKDYEASLQWRFYLLVHGAKAFQYNLFDFREPKGGMCVLKDILSFRFWTYTGLEEECRSWLGLFLDWANGHDLLPCLEREGSTMLEVA